MGPVTRREWVGESLGTFLLVLFGCGSVAVSILFNAHPGLMPIALAWGMGIMLAVYLTRGLSPAHLNPAVSIAMVVGGRLPLRKLPGFLAAQFAGAVAAALMLYLFFGPSIAAFERAHDIARGTPASIATAKMFGEYYAAPGTTAVVTLPLAVAVEAVGTFLLVLAIFGLTERVNDGRPDGAFAPVFIGLTVTSLICLIAPLTQACFNPARDLGPRLVAATLGWGPAAFPDRVGGFFWVYVLGPVAGGALAALVFTRLLEPLYRGGQS